MNPVAWKDCYDHRSPREIKPWEAYVDEALGSMDPSRKVGDSAPQGHMGAIAWRWQGGLVSWVKWPKLHGNHALGLTTLLEDQP